MAMALPYTNNWACTAIRDLMLEEETDAKEVARIISTQPRFLEIVQEVIDLRNNPNYDPKMPDGDPAQQLVGKLSRALVEVG